MTSLPTMSYHANDHQHTLTADFSRGLCRMHKHECTSADTSNNLLSTYSQGCAALSCNSRSRPERFPSITTLQMRRPSPMRTRDARCPHAPQSVLSLLSDQPWSTHMRGTQFSNTVGSPVLRTDPVADSNNCRIHWPFSKIGTSRRSLVVQNNTRKFQIVRLRTNFSHNTKILPNDEVHQLHAELFSLQSRQYSKIGNIRLI